MALNRLYERVRAAEDAPRGRCHVLKRRHGLAKIVERGGGVVVERLHVKRPTLVSDAGAWAARRGLYLQLYRASEAAGIPTFIAPPPGCGEDEYDLRAVAESIGNLDPRLVFCT